MARCKMSMYHYVRPIKKSQYPEIKGLELEGFIRQLNYFQKNFTFLSAKDIIDAIYNNQNIPQNSMVLTFDDGLQDHYSHVFPILKKFQIQGLFFPPAKPIEENIVLDVHKIHFILANCKNIHGLHEELIELIKTHQNEYGLSNADLYISTKYPSNKFDNDETVFIKRTLQKGLPKNARKEFVNILFKKYVTEDEITFSKELYLSKEQISEMNDNGMYFGSHSYSHEWFENISESELETELEKNSHFLTKINKNKDSWIMCYPYGSYNEIVIRHLKKWGYRAGLTIESGDTLLSKKNAFKLQRYDTNNFPQ